LCVHYHKEYCSCLVVEAEHLESEEMCQQSKVQKRLDSQHSVRRAIEHMESLVGMRGLERGVVACWGA
jgi:hypothetical protein